MKKPKCKGHWLSRVALYPGDYEIYQCTMCKMIKASATPIDDDPCDFVHEDAT